MSTGEVPVVVEPSYALLSRSGELGDRVRAAYDVLQSCELCGRQCKVDRTRSARGAGCRTGMLARLDGFDIDRGLEACLTGPGGAGIVRFSYCNLRCRTCETFETHQRGRGREMTPEQIADGMLRLQEAGAGHLVLQRPSHVIPQALAALDIAAGRGLTLPVVYDSGGYDHPTGLALLDGVVDVYVVAVKFGNSGAGRQIARVRDYSAKNRAALTEMHRQVGDLEIDDDGLARRGLLVRHQVLPNGQSHPGPVFRFLAEKISKNTALRLIDGFEPVYQSEQLPMLRRGVTDEEFARVEALADRHGLRRRLPS